MYESASKLTFLQLLTPCKATQRIGRDNTALLASITMSCVRRTQGPTS